MKEITTLLFSIVLSFTANAQPNILLINIDDMGWRDVGFMGSEYYLTPNIDALAAEGMIFTNFCDCFVKCSIGMFQSKDKEAEQYNCRSSNPCMR